MLDLQTPARVENVQLLKAAGPWRTKADAQLFVPIVMSQKEVYAYVSKFDKAQASTLVERGLRIYFVFGMCRGSVGGTEFHRIRKEFSFTIAGCMRWTCEDMYGASKSFDVSVGSGIYVPPTIMHTIEGVEETNSLMTIANTLYDPEDARTFDTYAMDIFREEQQRYA
jgi:mannose-6-phosphate isomerase-like protein (cupin superfamily)